MNPRDNVETGETDCHPEGSYVLIPHEAPCKQEQEKLSGLVKNVHRKLRRKYKEGKQLVVGPFCGTAALWLTTPNLLTYAHRFNIQNIFNQMHSTLGHRFLANCLLANV